RGSRGISPLAPRTLAPTAPRCSRPPRGFRRIAADSPKRRSRPRSPPEREKTAGRSRCRAVRLARVEASRRPLHPRDFGRETGFRSPVACRYASRCRRWRTALDEPPSARKRLGHRSLPLVATPASCRAAYRASASLSSAGRLSLVRSSGRLLRGRLLGRRHFGGDRVAAVEWWRERHERGGNILAGVAKEV